MKMLAFEADARHGFAADTGPRGSAAGDSVAPAYQSIRLRRYLTALGTAVASASTSWPS
jgi:hypothetical protein